jgi:hypothetical protein
MSKHTEAEMREALGNAQRYAAPCSTPNCRSERCKIGMVAESILADAIAELLWHRSELEKAAQQIADARCGAPGPHGGRSPEPRKPVCAVCNDTHWNREFVPTPCVECPQACPSCNRDGSQFCATTPCDCACHR